MLNGKREGVGKMIYKNGSTYEGEWKEDKKQGYGKYIINMKIVIDNYWYNDELIDKEYLYCLTNNKRKQLDSFSIIN